MSNWRLARSLEVLRDEVNERWPDRFKNADGTIGDTAHQNQGSASDHNPWVRDSAGTPVVRAFDITSATIDAAALAEHLRRIGAAGDARLRDHGYVIFNGLIASGPSYGHAWEWRRYDGDPHTTHIHLSVSRTQSGYDDANTWGVAATPPALQEDDLTPEQAQKLDEIHQAITLPDLGKDENGKSMALRWAIAMNNRLLLRLVKKAQA